MYEDILEKIARKGWNLYDIGKDLEQNLLTIVPRGNATSLEINRNYLVLPVIAHPKNVDAMGRELINMRAQQMLPILYYKQLTIPIPAFIIIKEGVRIYSRKNFLFPYDEFVLALDTLVDRMTN